MRSPLAPFAPLVPLVLRPVALLILAVAVVPAATFAQDVTGPAAVTDLAARRAGRDVSLSWSAVTTDVLGGPETVGEYRVYRGGAPDFVPDRVGGANRIGVSASTSLDDAEAAAAAATYYYLVSAVDADGNESGTRPSALTPPTLSGSWTDVSIDLDWTDAEPRAEVAGYRVYSGRASRRYERVEDVGLTNRHSLAGIAPGVNWYSAVTAIDRAGNESGFSNEHVDVIGGVIDLRAHDDVYLCWGAGNCPPGAGQVQRRDGWQVMVPVEFPEGDWSRVTVSYTLDSRLCGSPTAPDKCGQGNPGGWNPCGDPWDRTAHLFLVLDDCIETGSSCLSHGNVELMRAVTPFGTDAPAPDGSGRVPPRVLTLDVTPLAPLLAGRRYVGADIVHWVQAGWHVSVDFRFSKRPADASPKPPADGIEPLFFGDAPPPVATVAIPADARQVVGRLFTTGHGGTLYCDGGTNDGLACTSSFNCPGGSCQYCDEFCHRTNRILVDGTAVWQTIPWRTDCNSGGCQNWNACGFPSCTYPRAGWCPGYVACHQDPPCDQDIDLTGSFPPGGTYDVGYDVLVQQGSWPVSLVLYWYR